MSLRTAYKPTGSKLLLPITFLFIIILILFIAELGASVGEENKYIAYWSAPPVNSSQGKGPRPTYPNWRWKDYGSDSPDGISRFFFRSYTMIAELIHLPIHHYFLLSRKRNLHPIAALVLTFVFFGLWFTQMFWAVLYSLMDENLDEPTTERVSKAAIAFIVLVDLLYLVYFGCAARQVHVWRKARKAAKLEERAERRVGGLGEGQGGVELVDRKQSVEARSETV
ncbi:hypothetical protein B0J11DRAFT_523800 [Dendryphion nanum]|uniref:Uncharacterized protein n=1 Tax=Dendryphion nanum TaxID=256645 RepID=A0A9P9E4P0_9PLEO|nr:hypothetical protein B0J11DRAFT_523800 [Dendryphion nanum]